MATTHTPGLVSPERAFRDFVRATRRDRLGFAAWTLIVMGMGVSAVLLTYFAWLTH